MFESCASDTHVQNGSAERFGYLIMEKAQAMKLSINLPHKLWREIVIAVTYLYNQTLCVSNSWKSPYKAFHCYVFDKKDISGPRKLQLHHLRTYSCKVYVLTKSKGKTRYQHKLCKLDPKSHINFLISYKSTNIY